MTLIIELCLFTEHLRLPLTGLSLFTEHHGLPPIAPGLLTEHLRLPLTDLSLLAEHPGLFTEGFGLAARRFVPLSKSIVTFLKSIYASQRKAGVFATRVYGIFKSTGGGINEIV